MIFQLIIAILYLKYNRFSWFYLFFGCLCSPYRIFSSNQYSTSFKEDHHSNFFHFFCPFLIHCSGCQCLAVTNNKHDVDKWTNTNAKFRSNYTNDVGQDEKLNRINVEQFVSNRIVRWYLSNHMIENQIGKQ